MRGRVAAIVVSAAGYPQQGRRKTGLAAFFAASPLVGIELDIGRNRNRARPVDLQVRFARGIAMLLPAATQRRRREARWGSVSAWR